MYSTTVMAFEKNSAEVGSLSLSLSLSLSFNCSIQNISSEIYTVYLERLWIDRIILRIRPSPKTNLLYKSLFMTE